MSAIANPFVTNTIDKSKIEKIELDIHSDILDYFKKNLLKQVSL